MWRWEEEIIDDLNSIEPERVAAGLQDLKTRMDDADEFDLPPLKLEILKPFERSVPEEIQRTFLDLISHYRSFVPPLSTEQFYAALIELVLQYGEYSVAYEAALEIKIADHPLEAVSQAMQEILHHKLSFPEQICRAKWFISCLLDGIDEVRQAVLYHLAQWPNEPAYQQVIDSISPALTDRELEMLKLMRLRNR